MSKMQAQFLKLLLDSKNIKFYCQVAVEVSKHFLSLYCPDIPMLPTEGASLKVLGQVARLVRSDLEEACPLVEGPGSG